nr:restriction endonuclease subunit S [Oceanospirillum sediminis]
MTGRDVKVINQKNIISNNMDLGDFFISKEKYEDLQAFKIQKGDILVTTRGTIGKTSIFSSNQTAILHPCLIRLQIDENILIRQWLALIIQESGYVIEQILVKSNATTIEVIYSENLLNVDITYPPCLKEQRTIAAFLNHETARIDQLIEKQQQLIKLLKEKRQAVISHAVTKGLNPDVAMKDSGVEWLGKVPKHWVISRLKYEAKIVDCKNRTPEYFDDGSYLVVRTTNVKNQNLLLDGALYTNDENFKIWTQRGIPPIGSILFTREAPTGEVCLVPEYPALCMGQRMMNFIPHDSKYTVFLFDYLTSDCLNRYIESEASGSTVTHLRVEQVYNIPVVIPPYDEQVKIDQLVSNLKNNFNLLIEQSNDAIELMKERRTALISAAVTGKIDLRGWQPPAQESA